MLIKQTPSPEIQTSWSKEERKEVERENYSIINDLLFIIGEALFVSVETFPLEGNFQCNALFFQPIK